jgi:hypothetical protein
LLVVIPAPLPLCETLRLPRLSDVAQFGKAGIAWRFTDCVLPTDCPAAAPPFGWAARRTDSHHDILRDSAGEALPNR